MTFRMVALASALALAGCASGPQYDPAAAGKLQAGVSTDKDAVSKMGPPISTIHMADGNVILVWFFPHRGFSNNGGNDKTVIIFGRDRRMIQVMQQAKA